MRWPSSSEFVGLIILFMLFDGGIKLVPLVIESTAQLGYPANPSLARGRGILGLCCTVLYAFPRTSALGAILLTGYLRGTVPSARWQPHLQSHAVRRVSRRHAVGGLYLRDGRLRTLIPYRR
jgi:hypothetical protein